MTDILTPGTPSATGERSTLTKLYLIRSVLAVAWAAIFAGTHDSLGAVAITLLVVYPLIDAVSSLIDRQALRPAPNAASRHSTQY
jgi:tryptophan-rich sensory protein